MFALSWGLPWVIHLDYAPTTVSRTKPGSRAASKCDRGVGATKAEQ